MCCHQLPSAKSHLTQLDPARPDSNRPAPSGQHTAKSLLHIASLPMECFVQSDGSAATCLEPPFSLRKGVTLLSREEALKWTTQHTADIECAIVVPGDVQVEGVVSSPIQIRLSTTDGTNPLIRATLINGSLPRNVQEGPLKYFFQRSLDVDNKPDVLDAFSRIWLKQGRPVAAREADAFRFNILVPADKEAVFLRLSGFRGCFYSPKTFNNQPDARYALIWSKLSHSDLIGLYQKKDLECHVGLVRGRRGLAVRVPTDNYQQVRGIISPGLAPREYLPANFFWKLSGAPFAITASVLESSFDQTKRRFRVHKLRAGDWLLSSQDKLSSEIPNHQCHADAVKPIPGEQTKCKRHQTCCTGRASSRSGSRISGPFANS